MAQAAEKHPIESSFLDSANAEYIAHLYTQFLAQPGNVDASWREFFSGLNDNERDVLIELTGASWTPHENRKADRAFGSATVDVVGNREVGGAGAADKKGPASTLDASDLQAATHDTVQALSLIRAYRNRGHIMADLDPLGMRESEEPAELNPSFYGFDSTDYDRPIYIGGFLGLETATLREILALLKKTYCGKIGVEYMHLTDLEERHWLQTRIEEEGNTTDFTPEGRKSILQALLRAEAFEQFLHKKHPGTKRFGIDGGESLIPAVEQIIKRGGQMGLKEVVIGMAHRGRLNMLANIMGKPYTAIFAEFQGAATKPEDVQGSGDVKYHLGASSDREFDGNSVHLSLTANPSHLEFVNPVVIGKVRAKQMQRGTTEDTAVLPMLLHGDAAFAGQGVTAETLMIAELPGYRVGGTVHVVINNQIGFTTMPKFGRSGPYCTDVAKMLSAPIFHVNGDDPEAVVHVARVATEFRQTFKKDVVIDMYCYRRFGHNEGDEPAFTQPLMYDRIGQQETTRKIYTDHLIAEGVLTAEEAQAMEDEFLEHLEACFSEIDDYKPDADFFGGVWKGLTFPSEGARRGHTAVTQAEVDKIGSLLSTVPDDFSINRKLKRVVDARGQMAAGEQRVDWATAESMAFGTLLDEGYSVRLSGQDVGRGTFSQRHAIWYDQENGEKYIALQNISDDQGKFEVHDSPLSEMAVMGFEYGYSLADPKTLTLWEAQFGDFANGAQVMIDQFIASGEIKWLRMSGLVLLLPHGFEGQGPEHSSARLERFLQLSAEDNWQVCNCTTPANYFHVLRRQMHRDFRKPLIMMTPKSLLRHKLATSKIEQFMDDSSFHRFLWDDDKDELVPADKMKRVVLCTGKVYYDLLQERRDRGIKDVYILRLEQLYPFYDKDLGEEIKPFINADVVWCQEEPKNQGAWHFVDRRIEAVLQDIGHKTQRPIYAGRAEAASVATGQASVHAAEQAKLIDEALSV
jgi:2-oxoglutarate dehydrogenase E1 component